MKEGKKCYSCRKFSAFVQTEQFNGLKVFGLCHEDGANSLPYPVYKPFGRCEKWEARDGDKA